MRILEILLSKEVRDKGISQQQISRIDALQKRMDSYVDKICDPKTSPKGREFLKAKLRDDYHELKDVIEHVHKIAEDSVPPVEPVAPIEAFEVVDSKTGKVVGKPYSSRSRARARVDKLDNEYGGYRFKVRRVGGTDMYESKLNEAVHKLPLTEEDFELVKTLMSRPIPAVIAPIYIQEIIDDDEFNDMLNEFAEMEPGMDIRPHVAEWFNRVMPDQMWRFGGDVQSLKQKLAQTSVIHGYDPHMYHGSNEPITGDAFGRR
jgi:hypothetical protein